MNKVVVYLNDTVGPYAVYIKHFITEAECRAYLIAMREMQSYTGYSVTAKINGKEV